MSSGDLCTLPEVLELSLLLTAIMSAALMDESPTSRLHDSCIMRLWQQADVDRGRDVMQGLLGRRVLLVSVPPVVSSEN